MALGNGGRVRMSIGLRPLEEGDAVIGGGSDADAGRQVAIPAAQIAPSVDDLAGRTAVACASPSVTGSRPIFEHAHGLPALSVWRHAALTG